MIVFLLSVPGSHAGLGEGKTGTRPRVLLRPGTAAQLPRAGSVSSWNGRGCSGAARSLGGLGTGGGGRKDGKRGEEKTCEKDLKTPACAGTRGRRGMRWGGEARRDRQGRGAVGRGVGGSGCCRAGTDHLFGIQLPGRLSPAGRGGRCTDRIAPLDKSLFGFVFTF